MHSELTRDTENTIQKVSYIDGTSSFYVGDYYGTRKIIPYDENGIGGYCPWLRVEGEDGRLIARIPAHAMIIIYDDIDVEVPF